MRFSSSSAFVAVGLSDLFRLFLSVLIVFFYF
jgi:hypothetical protein